jgi:restriction system protein
MPVERMTLDEIDLLSWKEFEAAIADLFARLGYETEQVGGRRDHGADIIARRDGIGTAIQVKHRRDRRWVGERAVQAVVTARPLYNCEHGIVVTNSTFAPSVAHVAAVHGIELWDRPRLALELSSFCTLCGRHVSTKVRDWCLQRPDAFGGRVYCFDHQHNLAGLIRTA